MDPLLSTNVKSPLLGKKMTIASTCLKKEYPHILEEFEEPILHICLQEHHMDRAAWKIMTLARVNKVKTIHCVTVDGSPHCLGLHHALEDVKAALGDLEVNHWVVEKGELIPVGLEAVRASRHLREIEDLVK